MANIYLSELLHDYAVVSAADDCQLAGIAQDSREIKPGYLFVAIYGTKQDGGKFIIDAINNGACAVVCEKNSYCDNTEYSVPVIPLENLAFHLGYIASKFYGEPTNKMRVVGITGTNGKTSCSQYIARALENNAISCGIIGTCGSGFPEKLQPGKNTTPGQIFLQQTLLELQQQGAAAIAMEVSSHGLEQNRVNGINFNIAVFTNLTRDHLDYHQTMENYFNAKRLLFMHEELEYLVINGDDEYGLKLIDEFAGTKKIIVYTLTEKEFSLPTVRAVDIKYNQKGIGAVIYSPWGDGSFTSKLLGRFNLYNLLAVFTVLNLFNLSFSDSISSLVSIHAAKGRMQTFGGGNKPLVVVDYAHTPDALQQALEALRVHCHGRLWCLFGCGGDRDRGKRPEMARIAEHLSDQLIITDDNPRTENPEQITNDIVEGLLCPWAVEVVHDREVAIAHVIDCAKAKDVILIAGKGHEEYQIIGEEKIVFSDIDHVKQRLRLKHAV